MLTVYDNTEKIFESLCAGACGYISKQTPLPRIREALVTVYEGGAYMSPGIRPPVGNRVFSRFHGFRLAQVRGPVFPSRPSRPAFPGRHHGTRRTNGNESGRERVC